MRSNPWAWSPGIMDDQEMRRREFAPESNWPKGGLADARWDGDKLIVPVGTEWRKSKVPSGTIGKNQTENQNG